MQQLGKWLRAHPLVIVLGGALLLRVPFLDGSVDFFDSSQYLWRALLPNFLDALSSGHAPYHPGYVGWIWVMHQVLPGLAIAKAAALVNVLFSSLGLVGLFVLADRILGRRAAWLATMLMALTPYYWVGSITILIDPVMLALWILSLLLVDIGLERRFSGWFFGAGLCLGLAMLAHTQIAFWSLGFVALVALRCEPKAWLRTAREFLPFLVGPLLAIASYVYLLIRGGHDPDIASALHYLLRGNAGDHAPFALDLTIRNTRLVLGSVLALAAAIATVVVTRRQPRLGWSLALWLWPGAIVSSAYIYSNLSGRATMAAVVPAVLVVAAMLVPSRGPWPRWQVWGMIVVLASLLIGSGPLVAGYATGPAINEAMDQVRKALPQGGVYLASPESRTLSSYDHEVYVYDDSQSTIEDQLRQALDEGRPAFAASDAVTFPVYAYDGRSLRVFAPSPTRGDHGGQASFLFNEFTATPARDVSGTPALVYALGRPGSLALVDRYRQALEGLEFGSQFVIGRIEDNDRPVSRLEVNVHGTPSTNPIRIDAHDWLANLIRKVGVVIGYQTSDPLNWSYTDPEGVVAIKLPDGVSVDSYRLVPHPLDTARSQTPPPLFVDDKSAVISATNDVREFAATELATELANASDSVLAAVERIATDQYRAVITRASYAVSTTTTIRAGILAGAVGEIDATQARVVQAGTVGDATFGPWKKLSPGRYAVTWTLKRTDEGEGTAVKLDVSAGFGAETLTEQLVDASELPLNQSTEIRREFEVGDATGLLEFRTRAMGGPGFVIESLTVQPR